MMVLAFKSASCRPIATQGMVDRESVYLSLENASQKAIQHGTLLRRVGAMKVTE